MITVDTREKANAHILTAWRAAETPYKVVKLATGDYSTTEQPNVVVERKMSLDELAKNLNDVKDRQRFMREMRRAWAEGLQMTIVCEHGGGVKSLADAQKWRSKHSTITGQRIADDLRKIEIAYGIKTVFCERAETARVIRGLLEGQHEHTNTDRVLD